MTRTRWAIRAVIVVVCGVALLAQSPASSDAGIFLNKASGAPQRMGATRPQMHQKRPGANIVKNMFARGGAAAATFVFELQGAAADLRVDSNAAFMLRLTQKQATADDMPPLPGLGGDAGDAKNFMSSVMDTPPATAKKGEDFSIVHLKIDGGARQVECQQAKNNSLKTDASIAVKLDKTGTDTYTLQSKTPLEAGEYAIVYLGANGGGQFWAFGVDAK